MIQFSKKAIFGTKTPFWGENILEIIPSAPGDQNMSLSFSTF
jgi:hypothetical protein